ncbi:MAG TPA: MFS transporter [Methylomirabilota bacterium]|nr:MFS transporter [Methylomirabilota bacterium]
MLWLATFLFYFGFQLLLPVVPLYAASLGGREGDVGFIIGVFALAAMLLRPIAGELADRVGRRPLVLVGTVIFALAPLGYAAARSIPVLLLARLFHGVGMGLGPTAATAVVTDLTPPERRGAAMGLFGLASALGLALGPYLGIELAHRAGFAASFATAAAVEAVALALAWRLPETRPAPPAGSADGGVPGAGRLGQWARRWFSAGAVFPAGLILALYVSYGGLASFLPLFAARRQLGNPGLFFTVFAVASVAVRPVAGHVADRVGRRAVVAPALAVAAASLVLLAFAASPAGLLAAAAVYGVGFGAGQPALLAMATDRVPAQQRGRAMGTVYTAWELGISGGSVVLGLCAARFGYAAMWGIAAACAGAGALAALRDVGRARG